MNVNEECLLTYLNNPGRLELITRELREIILSLGGSIILNMENSSAKKQN